MRRTMVLAAVIGCVGGATGAAADDIADCQNPALTIAERMAACQRSIAESRAKIRAVTPYPVGSTHVSATFDGCNFGKKYELDNGWTMVCQTYRYHYAYRPTVVIIDPGHVVIDNEDYSVTFE